MSHQFSRKILLAVVGLSPQIITETLFALYQQYDFIPDEIQVITTANGKNRIISDLLDNQTGYFYRFCQDYGLKKEIVFNTSTIHVIHSLEGLELDDIKTREDNNFAADQIINLVRDFCKDENTVLHVSIAGGRKTMGFLLGYAMSLFARNQDVLSHVLVSEPYENNQNFYYPTPYSCLLETKTGEKIDASKAEVFLAEIPVISLRFGMPGDLLSGKSTYTETVKIAQQTFSNELCMAFSVRKKQLICHGVSIPLSPIQFATMLWLARRQQAGELPIRPELESDVLGFLENYREVIGEDGIRFEKAKKSMTDFLPLFQERRTRINNLLNKYLGAFVAKHYLIQSLKKYTETRYGIMLSPEYILILPD